MTLANATLPKDPSGFGDRRFYEIPAFTGEDARVNPRSTSSVDARQTDLLALIRRSIIGRNLAFSSPFGLRQVVYCDYTASGKSLSFIEDYIRDQVLPYYGNTHTTISVTSLQTTLFREEARGIIRNAVNASEKDAVLFVGSGCTGAIHKLISALHLQSPPVVFVGPYEHHSFLLPWREMGSEVISIAESESGLVDILDLERHLQKWHGSSRQLLGCFSAASNVTGILSNVDAITIMLHRYGSLAIWDLSASAPYNSIDMNPVIHGYPNGAAHKDAVVFSVHKFVGGVSTPGILVAKKNLFKNPVPAQSGGGTVFFVNSQSHRYLKEIENREEGGTAAIVESIRAGLVFRLKEAVTCDVIMQRDNEIVSIVMDRLQQVPNLLLLGNLYAPRLPIFSFVIRHPQTNRLLHHNYVSSLLNDLFGIQSRAGCACAGPYAQHLLGIDLDLARKIEEVLMEDPRLEMHRWQVEFSQREVLRPGFVRINFPYFFTDEDIHFVCEAVKMVAENGWKLLPLYHMNPETAEWRHRENQIFRDRKWLSSIRFTGDGLEYPNEAGDGAIADDFTEVLQQAKGIFDGALKAVTRIRLTDQEVSFDEASSQLRWFLLPSEARRCLCDIHPLPQKALIPFKPRRYLLKPENDLFSGPGCQSQNGSCNSVDLTCATKLNDDCVPCCNTVIIRPADSVIVKVARWHSPSKEIWKPLLTAVREFDMFRSGDRVLVCLSGGKDSLTLLHAMRQYQFFGRSVGIDIKLGAVTVDPLTSSYDPSSLILYLKALGIPYFYEQQGIMDMAATLKDSHSICSFCSRMKRGRLYSCARREGYNVLAFGQHLDDLAESFLMSLFHNGRLRTMKASYTVVEGDLRMVRPLVYVREKDTRRFAATRNLPVITENCPACFETPKERFRLKQLLAAQELLHPTLYESFKTAMKPLMAIKTAGGENHIPEIPRLLDEIFQAQNMMGVVGKDACFLQEDDDQV